MTIPRNLALGLACGLVAAAAAADVQAQARSQTETVVVTRVEPAPYDAAVARRSDLARELIGLSVGPNFAKEFERAMVTQMNSIGDKAGEESAWVRANMPPMMSRMLARVMEEMVPVYATIYTEEELGAQIDFYRTPAGRAVAAKTLSLGVALQEAQDSVLTSFMAEFESKYCARFDCGEDTETAAKSRR
ncbi:DUF2059 domain-containing protein [Brevundimonas sp.]|uniref:DUF2059 domain-containing protein n=1 Tax=Brevundimonas sp. TaxID=1871086 RepID=UPI00289648F2|nr:DUF2059 domain-containing protein [Brevundimonas sp.]